MNLDLLRVTKAGVSRVISNPFASMEINDQVNGVNGKVTDTASGAGSLKASPRVLSSAGVVRTPYVATASIVGK